MVLSLMFKSALSLTFFLIYWIYWDKYQEIQKFSQCPRDLLQSGKFPDRKSVTLGNCHIRDDTSLSFLLIASVRYQKEMGGLWSCFGWSLEGFGKDLSRNSWIKLTGRLFYLKFGKRVTWRMTERRCNILRWTENYQKIIFVRLEHVTTQTYLKTKINSCLLLPNTNINSPTGQKTSDKGVRILTTPKEVGQHRGLIFYSTAGTENILCQRHQGNHFINSCTRVAWIPYFPSS